MVHERDLNRNVSEAREEGNAFNSNNVLETNRNTQMPDEYVERENSKSIRMDEAPVA